MKNSLLVFVIFILLIVSCSIPKLGITKHDVLNHTFKTQGVYYNKKDFTNFIFYNNGVVLGGFGFVGNRLNIDSLVKYWSDYKQYRNVYNYQPNWGLFEVKGNKVNAEKWESRESWEYAIRKISATILNDSTLLLSFDRLNRDTFYFHYLAIKPDSTNQFIKQ